MTALNPVQDAASSSTRMPSAPVRGVILIRLFGWVNLAVMAAFLLNNYLTYWQGLPGIAPVFG